MCIQRGLHPSCSSYQAVPNSGDSATIAAYRDAGGHCGQAGRACDMRAAVRATQQVTVPRRPSQNLAMAFAQA